MGEAVHAQKISCEHDFDKDMDDSEMNHLSVKSQDEAKLNMQPLDLQMEEKDEKLAHNELWAVWKMVRSPGSS